MTVPSSGVLTTRALLSLGLDRERIDQLVSAGRISRLRRGWYAFPNAQPDIVRAVRLGGVLTCASALRSHGVWTPADPRLHIRLSEHLRAGATLPIDVVRCSPPGRRAPRVGLDSVAAALRAAVRCLDDEGVVVVIDSILNRGLLSPAELRDALADAPLRVHRLVSECDSRAESGTESMARFRLGRRGVRLRTQVAIPGVGRVDLLIGDRLVLEIDSRAHHTGTATYTADRERDRVLVRQGYLVLRLTYQHVVHDWARVEADILDLIRRDRHRLRAANRLDTAG